MTGLTVLVFHNVAVSDLGAPLRVRCPPPPFGKSWIHHCFPLFKSVICQGTNKYDPKPVMKFTSILGELNTILCVFFLLKGQNGNRISTPEYVEGS